MRERGDYYIVILLNAVVRGRGMLLPWLLTLNTTTVQQEEIFILLKL